MLNIKSANSDLKVVDLSLCSYNKATKVLNLKSDYVGMPNELAIRSNHTGKVIRFVVVKEHDVLFDQDGWDGELKKYRPVGVVPGVDHLVIHNFF